MFAEVCTAALIPWFESKRGYDFVLQYFVNWCQVGRLERVHWMQAVDFLLLIQRALESVAVVVRAGKLPGVRSESQVWRQVPGQMDDLQVPAKISEQAQPVGLIAGLPRQVCPWPEASGGRQTIK